MGYRVSKFDVAMTCVSGACEAGALVWYLRRRFWRCPR